MATNAAYCVTLVHILDLCMGPRSVRVNPAIDGCTFGDDYSRISITGLYILFLDILFRAFLGEMKNVNWRQGNLDTIH